MGKQCHTHLTNDKREVYAVNGKIPRRGNAPDVAAIRGTMEVGRIEDRACGGLKRFDKLLGIKKMRIKSGDSGTGRGLGIVAGGVEVQIEVWIIDFAECEMWFSEL